MAISTPPRSPSRRLHVRAAGHGRWGGVPRTGVGGSLGGARGNEVLTRMTATVLVLLLAIEGFTIFQIEGLVRVHMFVGMVLVPPVALKLASTGYRFARYYLGAREYREKGPPKLVLRLTAPILVLSTVSLFATGIWLMSIGHESDRVLSLHVASFVVWIAVFALHFLMHAPTVLRSQRSDWRAMVNRSLTGTGARITLLAASLGGGTALALAVLGLITGWHGD